MWARWRSIINLKTLRFPAQISVPSTFIDKVTQKVACRGKQEVKVHPLS